MEGFRREVVGLNRRTKSFAALDAVTCKNRLFTPYEDLYLVWILNGQTSC